MAHRSSLMNLFHLPGKVWRAWALCALAACGFSTSVVADDQIYSTFRNFRIPFEFDAEELEKLGTEKVQLYVSTNQGKSWRLHEEVAPAEEKFTYRATDDGEFWFSVRSITSEGLSIPAGDYEPGLKVIIDTSKPKLRVDVAEVKPGLVELNWEANDAHLATDSLQIERLNPSLNHWEKIEIAPERSGSTTWKMEQAGLVEIRAAVEDAAGNLSEFATQTIIAGTTPATSKPEQTSRPIAKEEVQAPVMRANQPISTDEVPVQIMPEKPLIALDDNPILPEQIAVKPEPSVVKSVSDSIEKSPPPPVIDEDPIPMDSAAPMPEPVAELAAVTEPVKPSAPVEDVLPEILPPKSGPLVNKNSTKKPVEPVLPESSKLARPTENSESEPEESAEETGHLVNSATFRIAYQVEDVGPTGVSKIELFITENSGRDWFYYGSDDDRVSPFVVTVPRDGEYGFTFRIRNGMGLTAMPPQPGTKPDISVTVDQIAPMAKLYSPQVVQTNDKNEAVITWSADDQKLHGKPIALYAATQPTGPWELISGWQANSGKFVWQAPAKTGKGYYIRMDVRDAAGNITRIDGDVPISFDRSRPKARITDIESIKIDSSSPQ